MVVPEGFLRFDWRLSFQGYYECFEKREKVRIITKRQRLGIIVGMFLMERESFEVSSGT